MKIFFIDEDAQDAGGVIKEWINILVDKIFSEEMGLFEAKVEDETFYVIKPNADLDKLYFAGQIVGKALEDNITIQALLSNLLLKELL